MKKTFALLLTLVMVFGLVASMPAYADDEIIINFPSIWVGTDSKAAYMSKMIEDFNAENAGKIKVVVEEQTDYQAYRDKIRTTITTGNAPDLCVLDTTFDIKAYAESGKFMDLTPYLNEGWGENFTDGAFDAWSVDGKVSILPFEAAVFPLVYNVEILKAGITSPPPMTSSSRCARTSRLQASTPWVRWRATTPGPPCSGTR